MKSFYLKCRKRSSLGRKGEIERDPKEKMGWDLEILIGKWVIWEKKQRSFLFSVSMGFWVCRLREEVEEFCCVYEN